MPGPAPLTPLPSSRDAQFQPANWSYQGDRSGVVRDASPAIMRRPGGGTTTEEGETPR